MWRASPAVRRALKKKRKLWLHKQWAIPTPGAEFVWRMEEVISLYMEEGDPDPRCPYVCFDETSKQLVAETRQPLPPKLGKPERFDYEYERQGTANVFMLVAPRLGSRQVNVTARRTRVDFALQMPLLVDDYFPQATTIRVALDNLNTYHPASLYEAFAPTEAKRILDRLEFVHTSKHGAWLNMAEIERSATPTKRASTGPSAWKMLAESSAASTPQLQHDEALVMTWRWNWHMFNRIHEFLQRHL